jgi:hypothetical protein
MGFLSLGGNSNFLFDTNASGDASTQLPANAVDSGEILDESGIASNHIATFGFIPSNNSGALSDLISITITTPAAGYVTVSGDFQANFINAAARAIGYQISETSGGPLDANYYFYAGVFNASMGGWIPCAIHRTFFKAAGAYTFYLQAYNENGTSVAYFNPTITAEFSSTSYGAVTTIASASEAATFRHATPVAASAAATQPVGRGYVVDLRELEMKVRADEAQLAESQRALREAQAREQGIAHVVLTSVKK